MKAPIEISRARLEAKIEELVALLDLLDGDENLEPYLADTYPEMEDRNATTSASPTKPTRTATSRIAAILRTSGARSAAICNSMGRATASRAAW